MEEQFGKLRNKEIHWIPKKTAPIGRRIFPAVIKIIGS